MKIAKDEKINIFLLGAGGTGGYIAPHLYRIAYAAKRKVKIIIIDGDIVEEKNLIRQNFAPYDIGEFKAEVIAKRYSEVFGIETQYMNDFIECEEALEKLIHDQSYRPAIGISCGLTILIGAVDNNRSRQICHNVFQRAENLIYIDSGNGEYTGQVVCGIKKNGKTSAKPVGSIYPDIINDKEEKLPTELSCAERSVSAPQSIAANLFASTAVTALLYQLIIMGSLNIKRLTFSARTMCIKAIADKRCNNRINAIKEAA